MKLGIHRTQQVHKVKCFDENDAEKVSHLTF